MSRVEEKTARATNAYTLNGTLLEACSCGVLCPCWIGEDPDGGECFSFEAYHVDRGTIGEVDVSGLTYAHVSHIPGNVLTPGSWRSVRFLDSKASEAQREALLGAFRGELGGPLAEVAELFDEELGVEVIDITYDLVDGTGTLQIGDVVEARMEPYRGPDGSVTTLRDSIFSTVPGSPAWISKASRHVVRLPKYGFEWEFEGRNAIQAVWKLDHAG